MVRDLAGPHMNRGAVLTWLQYVAVLRYGLRLATIKLIEFDDPEVVKSRQTYGGRNSEVSDGNEEGDEASNERWTCPM